MNTTIATDQPLSNSDQTLLRLISGIMIPADVELGVPGADDQAVQHNLLAIAARRAEAIHEALARFTAFAGPDLASADTRTQLESLENFRARHPREATPLISAVLQAYYQDDRVMQSLGMEPRPPFPKGYEVPEGDWSLIEPVRKRTPFWRHAPD